MKKEEWLRCEIAKWRSEGAVDAATADALLARYPVNESRIGWGAVVAIGWLVWRYERIVLNGTEVRLKCQAYDPYDPLRGRYLGMTVSEECTNIFVRIAHNRHCRSACFFDWNFLPQLSDVPSSQGRVRRKDARLC